MQAGGYAVSPPPSRSELSDLDRVKEAIRGLSRAVSIEQKKAMHDKALELLEHANDDFVDMERLMEQKNFQISQYKQEASIFRRDVEKLQSEVARLKMQTVHASQAPTALGDKEREAYETHIEQLKSEVDFFKQELEQTQRKLQYVLDKAGGNTPSAATQAAQKAHRVVSDGLEAGYAAGKSLAGRIGGVGTERDAPKGNIYSQGAGAKSIYGQPVQPVNERRSIYDDAMRGPLTGMQEHGHYRNIYDEERGSGFATAKEAVSAVDSKIWVMRHAGMLSQARRHTREGTYMRTHTRGS